MLVHARNAPKVQLSLQIFEAKQGILLPAVFDVEALGDSTPALCKHGLKAGRASDMRSL